MFSIYIYIYKILTGTHSLRLIFGQDILDFTVINLSFLWMHSYLVQLSPGGDQVSSGCEKADMHWYLSTQSLEGLMDLDVHYGAHLEKIRRVIRQVHNTLSLFTCSTTFSWNISIFEALRIKQYWQF